MQNIIIIIIIITTADTVTVTVTVTIMSMAVSVIPKWSKIVLASQSLNFGILLARHAHLP